MWIYTVQLVTVVFCVGVDWSHALEKDIEVKCLDPKAITVTEGGLVANCAFSGLTRTSTISPWLFQLANVLQGVNASHNHFTKVTVFPLLPRVLTMTLAYNNIKDIEPLAFTGLENLQNLDLSNNRITGDSLQGVLVGKKILEKYEPLPIRMLFLSHNDISSLEPSVFSHLQYLRDLHLDYNPVEKMDANFSATLRELPELKLLNLAGTGLSSLPKDAFSGLTLTSLMLNGNQFTQVPDLSAIGGYLQLLNINQNPIEKLDESSFAGLHSLREIVASGMPNLTTIQANTFSKLDNIRIISCSYNPQLETVDESAFWTHNLKNRFTLKEVYLNNNALPRIRKNILPWLKVTKVTLDGNKFVCDCRLHWLANFLRSRNTTIDRLTELKCWEPNWLNGTQILFWEIDTKSRYENFACQAEQEEERKELERLRLIVEQKKLAESKLAKSKLAESKLAESKLAKSKLAESLPPSSEEEKGSVGMYHLIIIGGIIALIVIIGSIIAFNKYRNYRPIYNVEKMSSPMHNEMTYLKGTAAEKTQLVP